MYLTKRKHQRLGEYRFLGTTLSFQQLTDQWPTSKLSHQETDRGVQTQPLILVSKVRAEPILSKLLDQVQDKVQ